MVLYCSNELLQYIMEYPNCSLLNSNCLNSDFHIHLNISVEFPTLQGDMDEGKEASSAELNNSGRYWIGLCRNYGKGNLRVHFRSLLHF